MSNTINDSMYTEIKEVVLNDPGIGANINERFKNIDDNFKKIIGSEYLKGVKGDSIYTVDIVLDNSIGESAAIYKELKNLILYGYTNTNDRKLSGLDGKTLTLIYEKENDFNKEPKLISSLPFTFKDLDFNHNLPSDTETNYIDYIDLSCIICYQEVNGEIKPVRINSFPTLYYSSTQKDFCWKVNGVETELLAKGLKGDPGKTGSGVLMARHEDVDVEYTDDNEKIYKYREITHIMHPFDNNTGIDNPESKDAVWVEIANYSGKETWIDGCLIFSVDNIEYENFIKNGIPVEDGTGDSTPHWDWGLLFIDTSTGAPIYKIKEGGSLSNLIGTDGLSLLSMMKMNRYTFIPTYKDGDGKYKDSGYVLYDKEDEKVYGGSGRNLIIQPVKGINSSNDSITDADKIIGENIGFRSLFKCNFFDNGIEIGTSWGTNNQITITPKIVSFKNVLINGCIDNAIKLGTISTGGEFKGYSIGATDNPVYFSNGIPMVCSGPLNLDINGTSNNAIYLGTTLTSGFERYNIGTEDNPVYFCNGMPVACKGISANISKKLVDNSNEPLTIGNTSTPVWFENGVPVACSELQFKAKSANQLVYDENDPYNRGGQSLNVGGRTMPVYFKDGVPMQCNETLEASVTGSAQAAYKLVDKTFTSSNKPEGITVGGPSKPVYFEDGVPVECDNITQSTVIVEGGYTGLIGGSQRPVYWSVDHPEMCGDYLNINSDGSYNLLDAKGSRINVGNSSTPVYFVNGVPKACDVINNIEQKPVPESKLTWDWDKNKQSDDFNPIDLGLLATNKLSFMNPDDIEIEYYSGGGWKSYGNNNDDSYKRLKTSLVTTSKVTDKPYIYLGKNSNSQRSTDQLRVTITAGTTKDESEATLMCFDLKKILIKTERNSAENFRVKVELIKMDGTSVDKGYFNLGSSNDWCSIPLNIGFGGRNKYSNNRYRAIRFTFMHSGSLDGKRIYSRIRSIEMFGVDRYMGGAGEKVSTGGPLAELGHICEWDMDRNIIIRRGDGKKDNYLKITPPSDDDPGSISLIFNGTTYTKSLKDLLS